VYAELVLFVVVFVTHVYELVGCVVVVVGPVVEDHVGLVVVVVGPVVEDHVGLVAHLLDVKQRSVKHNHFQSPTVLQVSCNMLQSTL
jgi:hypothetical protein